MTTLLTVSIVTLIFSVLALIAGMAALGIALGIKFSTHRVIQQGFEPIQMPTYLNEDEEDLPQDRPVNYTSKKPTTLREQLAKTIHADMDDELIS